VSPKPILYPGASAGRIAIGVVTATLAAIAVNALIAVLALAAGASEDFEPLQLSAYALLTVVGALAAVRRWARRPAAVLRWLVPAVVIVSLLPDLALLPPSSGAQQDLAQARAPYIRTSLILPVRHPN
jgi:hypothetical protein